MYVTAHIDLVEICMVYETCNNKYAEYKYLRKSLHTSIDTLL